MSKLLITESEKNEILNLYNVSSHLLNEATGIPKTYNEIINFQNWVLKRDKKVLGPSGVDGKWGPKTQLAWTLYGTNYLSSGRSQNSKYNSLNAGGNKQGYPYDKLNNKPTSKFIAWIIKTSDGGLTGNDKEAYAEAAFNAIKTPKQYSEVAKYLAKEPYDFINSFMDTTKRYHLKSVNDHFIELYGVNPQNRPKVFKPDNIKDFQKWVINVKKDKVILGRYGADGDWGPNSVKAWYKYGNEYLKTNKNDDNLIPNDESNLIISKTINPKYLTYVKPNKINSGKSNMVGNVGLGVDTCAAFVHDVDSEMPYVGDAWLAYNNSDLGPLVFSSFNNLSPDSIKKLGDMYSLIIKNNGGKKNGKFNSDIGKLVGSLIKPLNISLKLGDFVGMYNPGSHNHEKALFEATQNPMWYDFAYENPYFTKDGKPNIDLFKDNEGIGLNTHVGMVGAIKDGVPIIFHAEDGLFYADPANRIVGDGKVAWVRRLGDLSPISYNQLVSNKSIS
jgi:hypothetical protein